MPSSSPSPPAAFWLSYAHLAEVAGQHGLGRLPVRQWAWPATLDAFIVAGELLMLRAGLRRVTDGWAIALTATGSVGSIALNVAGVSGTGGAGTVPLLDYVVAAVPPTAALLAFGVLMRQIHQLVDRPDRPTGPEFGEAPEPATDLPTAPPSHRLPVRPSRRNLSPGIRRASRAVAVRRGPGRGARGDRRTAAAEQGKLTRALLRKAVRTGTDDRQRAADRGDGHPPSPNSKPPPAPVPTAADRPPSRGDRNPFRSPHQPVTAPSPPSSTAVDGAVTACTPSDLPCSPVCPPRPFRRTTRDARPAPPRPHPRRAAAADEVPYADGPFAAGVRKGCSWRSQ